MGQYFYGYGDMVIGCNGEKGYIVIQPTQYPNYYTEPLHYKWSNGMEGDTIKDLDLGVYYVTVTDSSEPPKEMFSNGYAVYSDTANPKGGSIFLKEYNCLTGRGQLYFSIKYFVNRTYSYYDFYWEFPNGKTQQNVHQGNITTWDSLGVTAKGRYIITYTSRQTGCTSRDTFYYDPPPLATSPLSIELPNADTIDLGDHYLLEPKISSSATDLTQIQWYQGADSVQCALCPTLSIQPDTSSVYSVRIRDKNWCEAAASTHLVVNRVLMPKPYIPNVFSPNADTRNDYFCIYPSLYIRQVLRMQVFDRWGGVVFDKKDFLPSQESDGWDGTCRGQPCNMDTYTYWLEVQFKNGATEKYGGDVFLMR